VHAPWEFETAFLQVSLCIPGHGGAAASFIVPHITAHIEDVLASAGRSEATPAPLLLLDLPRLMYCIGIGRDTIAVGRARLFEFKSSTLSFMLRAASCASDRGPG